MTTLVRSFQLLRGHEVAWVPLLVSTAFSPPLALAMPLVQKRLIDEVVVPGRLDLLPSTAVLYAGLWLANTAFLIVSVLLRTYLSERLSLELRRRLFGHCEILSVAFSQREHSARTSALFLNDVPSLTALLTGNAVGIVGSGVAIVLAVLIMLSLNWQFALVAGVIPPLVAGAATVVTRPLRPATRRAQAKAAELNEHLQESLTGMRELVAFGHQHGQAVQFGATLLDLLRLRMRVAFLDTGIQAGQNLFSLAVTLAILGYGGYLVIVGETTLGTLVAMQSLFGYVFQPAGQLFGMIGSIQKALGAADRLFAFLDERPRVVEAPSAKVAGNNTVGEVRFEGVTFAYEARRPVLHDIWLTARPGETLALVGPSGAGKSTLVSLVARFYDPAAGRVLLDGVDLRELSLDGLRDQVGIVFQDSFLFARTIRENILLGRPDADEADVVTAAHAANAWEFIEQLPEGLSTQVGERGMRLSEGQKQRIAIARALLRDPRILILDEPTSALDARSEHLLQSALDNLMRGRTTFVIAHRLATVQRADRILVLEGGRLVEEGTHPQLMRRRGLYHDLYEMQFAGPDQGAPSGAAQGAVLTDGESLPRDGETAPRPDYVTTTSPRVNGAVSVSVPHANR